MQRINAEIKKLNVNGNMLNGVVSADLSSSKPFISANLQSNLLNLQTLTAKPQTTAFNFNLIAGANAAEFVPDTPLDLSPLNLLNANLTANIKQFVVDDTLSFNNISLKAALNNGVLNVSPLTLNAGGGNINGAISLNATLLMPRLPVKILFCKNYGLRLPLPMIKTSVLSPAETRWLC